MIVLAILGLLLPGYLLARALRVPAAWAAAFPLSAFLLVEIVIAYTLLGVPIRFGYVLALITVVSLVCLAAWLAIFKGTVPFSSDENRDSPQVVPLQAAKTPRDRVLKVLFIVVGVQVVLVLAGLLVRTTLYPLSGFDTAIRWDNLARLMLEHAGLAYYPPVTAADFAIYVYPDGIPPLTATIYWWLYAAWGSHCPQWSVVAVFLQAISCLSLVFCAARVLFGPTAGLVAVGVLSSSSLFLTGIAIGQETGYTALSCTGQLLFAFAAVRQPRVRCVVIAGIFAGLGALARDYGPLLSLCGFAVLAGQRETRRYLPLFCFVAVACGGPWYIRNWALTGNPLYPLAGLGFPYNAVHAGLMATYREVITHYDLSVEKCVDVVKELSIGATLALLVGVPGLVAMGRKGIAIGISVATVFLLWILSICYTAGGFNYTMRVLMPAWVALSIAAGASIRCWAGSTGRRRIAILAGAMLAFAVPGGYAVLACWSHPFDPRYICEAITRVVADPLETRDSVVDLAEQVESLQLPSTRILTDDCYFAVALQRYTRFQPVMIWSPEVAFVFDRQREESEVRRLLMAKGIGLFSIDGASVNNKYLCEFPLYHDYFCHEADPSQIACAIPEVKAIYYVLPSRSKDNRESLP